MTIRTRADLEGMTRSGRFVGRTLARLKAAVRPGTTTGALDAVAADLFDEAGAVSAPQRTYGFPGTVCISINDEVVHGVPGPRAIRPGDVVTIDVTADLDGFIADAAATVLVPPVAPDARRLARCARAAFARALRVTRPGRPVRVIGGAVEDETRRRGFHVVRELCGHGTGRALHETPSVPNFPHPLADHVLVDGLVLAIEPVLAAEPTGVVTDPDGWTIRTATGCLAVHHEHTVVVRDGAAPLVVTAT